MSTSSQSATTQNFQIDTQVCGKQKWRAFAPSAISVSNSINLNQLYSGSYAGFSNTVNSYAVSQVPKRDSSVLALVVIAAVLFIAFILWRIAHYSATILFRYRNNFIPGRGARTRVRGVFPSIIKGLAAVVFVAMTISLIYGGANTQRRIQDNFDTSYNAAKQWITQAQNSDASFGNALGTLGSTNSNQISPSNQSDILGQQGQAQTVLNSQITGALNSIQASQNQVDGWLQSYDRYRYAFTVGLIAVLILLGLIGVIAAYADIQALLSLAVFFFLIALILFFVLGWYYGAALLLGVDLCNQFEVYLYQVTANSQYASYFQGLMYYYLYGQVNADQQIQQALGFRYTIPDYLIYLQQFQGLNGESDAVNALNSLGVGLTRQSFYGTYRTVKEQICCQILNQIGVLQEAIVLGGSFAIALVILLVIVIFMLDFGAPVFDFGIDRPPRYRRFFQPVLESKAYFLDKLSTDKTKSKKDVEKDKENSDAELMSQYFSVESEEDADLRQFSKEFDQQYQQIAAENSMSNLIKKMSNDKGFKGMGQGIGQAWDQMKYNLMNRMREVKYVNLTQSQQQKNQQVIKNEKRSKPTNLDTEELKGQDSEQ